MYVHVHAHTHTHTHTHMHALHTQTQSGLTTSWDETITTDAPDEPKPAPPALDIPKELYQMVDYINRKGLETVRSLHILGGCQSMEISGAS